MTPRSSRPQPKQPSNILAFWQPWRHPQSLWIDEKNFQQIQQVAASTISGLAQKQLHTSRLAMRRLNTWKCKFIFDRTLKILASPRFAATGKCAGLHIMSNQFAGRLSENKKRSILGICEHFIFAVTQKLRKRAFSDRLPDFNATRNFSKTQGKMFGFRLSLRHSGESRR